MKGSLQTEWLQAIDVALAAVEAAARAGAMPVAEAADHRRLLAPERAWVEAFDWSPLDRLATVAILARSRTAHEDGFERAA
jgi:hypothetical protein